MVATRGYNPGGGVDREIFTKMTFVLDSNLSVGEIVSIPSRRLRIFYSTGLSYMPGKTGCYGQASSGSAIVRQKTNDLVELEFDAVFDLQSPLKWQGDCLERNIKSQVIARMKPLSLLDAWEGVPAEGDSLIAESVPYIDYNKKR